MRTLARVAVVLLGCAAIGCASKSGYNIDVRNNLSEPVRLAIKAAPKGEEPKEVDHWMIAAGATAKHFTSLEARQKATLEANVDGETARPPATMPIGVGETRIDLIRPTDRQASDPKQPRLRIRERVQD
jgi:hypothetical protein